MTLQMRREFREI
jgi:hypothetical protein